ncbi:MAG: saccharopine dehydrogenase family protein, partial [Myxococcota bacterium]
MPKAIVLGAGMVGSVMTADLVDEPGWDVAIADVRPRNLKAAAMRCGGRVETIEADLAKPQAVKKLVREYDIVLGALASAIGFQTLRAVIEAGKNYCDISFMPQNAIELDALAKKQGVTAIVDCGVAPGMSNMMAGHGYAQLEKCEKIEIYVGGLPRERTWPFQYKAGFSPHDVIEEYTRPSRIVEHGTIVEREALSEPELMDLPGVGTVEA